MTDAASQLRTALLAMLAADATLQTLLGGPGRVHDAPPRNAPMPYLALDALATRPIGGVDLDLAEHDLGFVAWSRAGGRREALALADRVDTLLSAAAPALSGHRLVSLRLVSREARLARDRVTAEARLDFRAVTEAL